MKNGMFFGTSILIGFWKGFGRGLGGQNPQFSHFFRYFFDVIFRVRFGRRKNREKIRKNLEIYVVRNLLRNAGTLFASEGEASDLTFLCNFSSAVAIHVPDGCSQEA